MLLSSKQLYGAWKDRAARLVLDPSLLLYNMPSCPIVTWADENNLEHIEVLQRLGKPVRDKVIVCISAPSKYHIIENGLQQSLAFAFNRYAYKPKDEFYRVYDMQAACPSGAISVIARTMYFYFYIMGIRRESRSVGLRNDQ